MIQILTDSTADLLPRRRLRLQTDVIAMTVHFGEQSHRDGVDLTHEEFFQKLAKCTALPTTSQPNPEEFAAWFSSYLDQGDTIIGIFLSQELSGTLQSAAIARDMLGAQERIFLVDSRSVTFGLGLLVEQACQMRDHGFSAEQIVAAIEQMKKRVRVYAVLDTLKYLKMGGRISSATAMVGGLMGVCPLVMLQDGRVEMAGKARGNRHAYAKLAELVRKDPPDPSLPIALAHANCLDKLAVFRAGLPLPENTPVNIGPIGSTIGTHVGPGAVGIGYFAAQTHA